MTQQSSPFGTDIWVSISSTGVVDIDPSARETGGIQVLAQSLVMRQLTPLGSIIGAQDEGIDLRNLLSKGMTLAQVQQVSSAVRNQIVRDQRVKTAVVNGVFNTSSNTLTLTEQIQSAAGPFTLVISVSSVSVTALSNGAVLGGT